MARPIKEGIDYFSIDLDIMEEGSVGYVDAKYGVMAFGLLIRLLIRIYRNGYYLMWTEREQFLFTKDISVDIDTTRDIVNAYINEGFFNKNLYEQYGILTSAGIQKRFLKACERRSTVPMIKDYYLIKPADKEKNKIKTDNVTFTTVNGDIIPVEDELPPAFSTQSKVKESKVKEKEKENKINAREDDGEVSVDNLYPSGNSAEETAETLGSQSLELSIGENPDFMSFWSIYPKKRNPAEAMKAWEAAINSGVSAKHMIMAALKYAKEFGIGKQDIKFCKAAENFLGQGAYKAYLPKEVAICPNCEYHNECKGQGHFLVTDEDDGHERVQICPYQGATA